MRATLSIRDFARLVAATVMTVGLVVPVGAETILVDLENGGEGYLNASQIERVSEPFALLLLVSGCGLALAFRRRKSLLNLRLAVFHNAVFHNLEPTMIAAWPLSCRFLISRR